MSPQARAIDYENPAAQRARALTTRCWALEKPTGA
jgi:hypothetical protein